eukprot:UN33371
MNYHGGELYYRVGLFMLYMIYFSSFIILFITDETYFLAIPLTFAILGTICAIIYVVYRYKQTRQRIIDVVELGGETGYDKDESRGRDSTVAFDDEDSSRDPRFVNNNR